MPDKSRAWRFVAALCASLSMAAHAAFPARTEVNAPQDIFAVASLDELVVTGEREKLSEARRALIAADDHFYAVFNAGNEDHAYDMLCRIETRTGTLIRGRVCTPRIVEEGTQAEASRLLATANGNVQILDLDSIREAAIVEMRRRVLERLKTDAELRRALLERAKLQQHLESLNRKKFEGRSIVRD